MPTRLSQTSNKTSALQSLGMIILLPAVIWLTHFWHSASFGLYEDDLTIIPAAIQMRLVDLLQYLGNYILHLYGHGRPLSDSFVELISNLSWRVDGLHGLYLAGFIVLSINAILFYLLIKRVASPAFAITSALAYCLFAADTTEPYVIASLGLQPSITFLLLAAHAYLSGKRALSYFIILGAIFCYETSYLVFLAVPLLEPVWDKPWFKRLVRHFILVIAILAMVIFLRSFSSEARVSDLTLRDILTIPISHSLIGPLVALGTYFYRPLQTLRSLNLEIALAILGSWIVFGLLFSRLQWETLTEKVNLWNWSKNKTARDWLKIIREWTWPEELPRHLQPILRLVIAGLALLILAYPLTFTIRPYAITGRDTRVHLSAVVGAPIVLTSIIAFLFYISRSYRIKQLLSWGVAGLLAFLVGFGLFVQKDYSQAWVDQQTFWTRLLPQIQDIGNGTVILVDPVGLGNTRQAGGNTWNMPRVLNQIYTFPADWKNPPRVYRLNPGWDKLLVNQQGLFSLDANTTMAPPSLYTQVPSTDVILFDTSGGKLTRQTGPLVIGGKSYPLKNPGVTAQVPFKKGFLYSLLIQTAQK